MVSPFDAIVSGSVNTTFFGTLCIYGVFLSLPLHSLKHCFHLVQLFNNSRSGIPWQKHEPEQIVRLFMQTKQLLKGLFWWTAANTLQ